jgi:soluble lytic murein transglycosylase-like protein
MLNLMTNIEKKIYHISKNKSIDHRLLLATAKAESNFNNFAHRPEEGFWKKYMKQNVPAWANQFKQVYGTRFEPDEKTLIFLFSSSYGMCQLMYSTAISNGFKSNNPMELFDETTNLNIAANYLNHLYNRYPEIRTSHKERMKFTIAAYNAGRGSINSMLRLARAYENKTINEDGEWQNWDYSKNFLKDITGNNAAITIKHIDRIVDILDN